MSFSSSLGFGFPQQQPSRRGVLPNVWSSRPPNNRGVVNRIPTTRAPVSGSLGRFPSLGQPPNQTSTAQRWRGLTPGEPPNQVRTPQSDGGIDWGAAGSDGGSGGGGGGGGFRAASWSAPSIGRTRIDQSMLNSRAHLDRAIADINSARQNALKERSGLDTQFQRRMNELRKQFQFTESAEEKRQLSRMVGELERQRDEGYRAIGAGYQRAVEQVQARGAQAAESTAAEQAEVGSLYAGAVGQVQGEAAALNEAADAAGGGALGVGADGGSAEAADWAALLAAEGASSQAMTRRLGDITQEGIGWMGDTLRGQEQAQQGDLRRLAMATQAQARMQHDQRVQDRINQERMVFNQMFGQTRSMYDQRGWQLGDTARQLQVDRGNLRFQFGEADIGRRLAASKAQAQLDAQRAAANAQMQAQARASNAAAQNQARAQAAAVRAQANSMQGHSVPDMLRALQDAPSASYRNMLGSYLVQNHGLPADAARRMGVR